LFHADTLFDYATFIIAHVFVAAESFFTDFVLPPSVFALFFHVSRLRFSLPLRASPLMPLLPPPPPLSLCFHDARHVFHALC